MKPLASTIAFLALAIIATTTAFAQDWRPAYITDVQHTIKRGWHPPKRGATHLAKVSFKIDSTGEIYAVKLTQTSGDTMMDQAAIKAVQKASPLAKFPEGVKDKSVEISMIFEYNIKDK